MRGDCIACDALFLYAFRPCPPDLIHIPIELHEDSPMVTELRCIQDCLDKIDQEVKHYLVRKGEQLFM